MGGKEVTLRARVKKRVGVKSDAKKKGEAMKMK